MQRVFLEYYNREGETFYHRTQFLGVFLYIELGVNLMVEQKHPEGLLWQARHAVIHNDILTSSAEQL